MACSCGLPKKSSGCFMKYWSSGFWKATKVTSESVLLLPARPACCQVEMTVPGYPEIITESREPMSIPNSRAFVDTTPFSVLFFSLFSISRLS